MNTNQSIRRMFFSYKLAIMTVCAAFGLGISSYLSWQGFAASGVAGCSANSVFDCNHVLGSHWSKVLGLPVSVLAVLSYVGMLGAMAGSVWSGVGPMIAACLNKEAIDAPLIVLNNLRENKGMAKLTIVANIKAKADKIDLVKAELEKLIDITRAEEGCVQYDLHQDNENPAHFLFFENWESRELWQTHMSAQHLQDYMAATDGAVEEFTLNEMTRVA